MCLLITSPRYASSLCFLIMSPQCASSLRVLNVRPQSASSLCLINMRPQFPSSAIPSQSVSSIWSLHFFSIFQEPWVEIERLEEFLGIPHEVGSQNFYFNNTKGKTMLTLFLLGAGGAPPPLFFCWSEAVEIFWLILNTESPPFRPKTGLN